MTETPTQLHRLVGVYDADATVRGELAYWVGARLGRAHCSLCDITHGLAREARAWREYRASLPVPFATFHRDDQPDAVRNATGGAVPVVVAETDVGFVTLLGPDALDDCGGSVPQLADAIADAIVRLGLAWPSESSVEGDPSDE